MTTYEQDYGQLSKDEQRAKLLERGFNSGDLFVIVDMDSNPNLPNGGLGYDYKTLLELTDTAVGLKSGAISSIAIGGRIHSDILCTIGESQGLVNSLNQFADTYDGSQPRFSANGLASAAYDPYAHMINFGQSTLNDWAMAQDSGSPEAILAIEAEIVGMLAHELAHSREEIKELNKNGTYEEYFNGSRMKEGAGLYWQYMTIREIYNTGSEKLYEKIDNKGYWEEGSDKAISANLYTKITELIAEYQRDNGNFVDSNPPNDLIYKIGIMGGQINMSSLAPGVGLTYDETRRWEWMSLHTDFAIDYLEALGIVIPRDAEGLGRARAAEIIQGEPKYSWDIKVLLNHYNNYIGHPSVDSDETLSVKAEGSPLGNSTEHGRTPGEVLWGGKGNDTLNGSGKNDTLLGGDDNDTLYGNGGNDYLAGNAGNDHLYGGTGVNILRGGEGDDTYHLTVGPNTANIIYDSGQSTIVWEGYQLSEVYRDNALAYLYTDQHGLKYQELLGNMYVFNPDGTLMAILNDFSFTDIARAPGNNFGLTVVNDNADLFPIPLFKLPGVLPGTGGDVYHTVTSNASQEGQYVGIKTGIRHDLVTGGRGNEVMDLDDGNDLISFAAEQEYFYKKSA